MSRELVLSSMGLALFIICPRMAGMACVIARHSQVSLVQTALLGSIVAIPLVVAMVVIFSKSGLWGALAFCVLTDVGAAFVMKEINMRAGVETLIIAAFVIIGVKAAPVITHMIVR